MSIKKNIFPSLIIFPLFIMWNALAYDEIECSTDSVFSEYSCNQCFDWWTRVQWDNLWLLTDLWSNVTDVKQILYKEEQRDPQMVNLSPSNVTWTQVPDSNNFWEYTDELNNLYNEDDFWYVLDPGKSVVWLKSTLSHAYNLEKNTTQEWENIWMLIYSIVSHNILSDGEVSMDDSSEHLECVLFKSWESAIEEEPEEEVIPETPKELPPTWPEDYLLLLIFAMIFSFWILWFRKKA